MSIYMTATNNIPQTCSHQILFHQKKIGYLKHWGLTFSQRFILRVLSSETPSWSWFDRCSHQWDKWYEWWYLWMAVFVSLLEIIHFKWFFSKRWIFSFNFRRFCHFVNLSWWRWKFQLNLCFNQLFQSIQFDNVFNYSIKNLSKTNFW